MAAWGAKMGESAENVRAVKHHMTIDQEGSDFWGE